MSGPRLFFRRVVFHTVENRPLAQGATRNLVRQDASLMRHSVLVRYGAIPEVARFESDLPEPPARGGRVVIKTDRGTELGSVLDQIRDTRPQASMSAEEPAPQTAFYLVRLATGADERLGEQLRIAANNEFTEWGERIRQWQLDLELIDLEWTLDREKLILYVVNDRGPECTKLAIQASVAELGPVHVQPVDDQGIVRVQQGGCGSGGCGTSGGACGAD